MRKRKDGLCHKCDEVGTGPNGHCPQHGNAQPVPGVYSPEQGIHQQIKTHKLAVDRVRRVAKGDTINGTYHLPPGEALDAFRADLLRIVGE